MCKKKQKPDVNSLPYGHLGRDEMLREKMDDLISHAPISQLTDEDLSKILEYLSERIAISFEYDFNWAGTQAFSSMAQVYQSEQIRRILSKETK